MFVTLMQKAKNSIGRILILGVALYLFVGLLFTAGGLYCYNVRNWDFYGGFSLPPLFFPLGIFFGLFLWLVYLWANLINGLGIFGSCKPLP
jgi:hypothetical protein